jgi:hypothetical protein
MIVILLYSVVCYLIAFGILLEEHDSLEEWSRKDIAWWTFAPVLVPIYIGIALNIKDDQYFD